MRFFATCDAMLHAREEGETFGMAVAEFSLRNKPVITYNGSGQYDNAHVRMLGSKALLYCQTAERSSVSGEA